MQKITLSIPLVMLLEISYYDTTILQDSLEERILEYLKAAVRVQCVSGLVNISTLYKYRLNEWMNVMLYVMSM